MKDKAQKAPAAILIIIALTLTFQFVFLSSDYTEESYNIDEPSNNSSFDFDEPGPWNILSAIWNVVTTFVDLLTFNIPGAPLYVRFPVGITITGSLAWSIASLIRG